MRVWLRDDPDLRSLRPYLLLVIFFLGIIAALGVLNSDVNPAGCLERHFRTIGWALQGLGFAIVLRELGKSRKLSRQSAASVSLETTTSQSAWARQLPAEFT
jgi:hypothetical protein